MIKQPLDIKSFFERNLQFIIRSQAEYTGLFENPQRPVADLPVVSRTGKNLPPPVAKLDDAVAFPEIRPRAVAELVLNDSAPAVQHSGKLQLGNKLLPNWNGPTKNLRI